MVITSIFNGTALASEEMDSLREAYKFVRQARRELKKQQAQERDLQAEDNLVVCIQCPQINGLVGDINKAMGQLVKDGQIEISERGALEEIERLEAMYYIVENDMEVRRMKGDDFVEPCGFYQLDIYLQEINNTPIRPEELTEIFSFNVDLNKINSIHYRRRDEHGRYYFYRAAPPDQDKIIRVHLPREGQATVTYFQRGTLPAPYESDYMKRFHRERLSEEQRALLEAESGSENKLAVEKVYGLDYWGELGHYKSESSEWTYGVAVAHKDNLPRRILLLQGRDETELFEGLKMKTEVEVSDRDQEVNVAFGDEHRDFLRLKAEADGDYRAALPFNMRVNGFDVGADGEIANTQDGNEVRLSFVNEGSRLLNVSGRRGNDDSQSISVGNSYNDVFLGGTLSVEYERSKNTIGDNEKVWFRYFQRF